MLIKRINTKLSGFEIFSLFCQREHCFFLDSSMKLKDLGRYSIIGFEPEITFKCQAGVISIKNRDGQTKEYLGNPFDELKALLGKYYQENNTKLPFIGGAVGYLGYDMRHYVEVLPNQAKDDLKIPDCFFGIYDGSIIIDHLKGEPYIAFSGIFNDPQKQVQSIEEEILAYKPQRELGSLPQKAAEVELKSDMQKAEFMEAIRKVRKYIQSGDIFQANMTQRFSCDCNYSPFDLYKRLRLLNPAPFSCYMDWGFGYIISSSPERLVEIRQGKAETRPIKGTRPRGNTPEEDIKNREELLASQKDQAELVMIVDLERNDLGKVCKIGSVKVRELFRLEEYATVYHLVSIVEGELKEDVHALDCLYAMFPGGSITGAPKIRAMEIIDELETNQRKVYTGSCGYIGFNGDADFNIAIRTILLVDGKAYFQVGGGIVWDSDPKLEYEETLHKAKALMKALGAKLKEDE